MFEKLERGEAFSCDEQPESVFMKTVTMFMAVELSFVGDKRNAVCIYNPDKARVGLFHFFPNNNPVRREAFSAH